MRVPDPDSSPDTSPPGWPKVDTTSLPKVASAQLSPSIINEESIEVGVSGV
jgi:hypothetical protein